MISAASAASVGDDRTTELENLPSAWLVCWLFAAPVSWPALTSSSHRAHWATASRSSDIGRVSRRSLSVENHLCPGMLGAPAARTSRRVQDIALLHGVWRCDRQMCVPRCGPAKTPPKKNMIFFFFFYTSSLENPRNPAEERAYILWKFDSPRPESSYLTLGYSNYSHYGEPLETSSRR